MKHTNRCPFLIPPYISTGDDSYSAYQPKDETAWVLLLLGAAAGLLFGGPVGAGAGAAAAFIIW